MGERRRLRNGSPNKGFNPRIVATFLKLKTKTADRGDEESRMSHQRVSERNALMRLEASSLSKRRRQDAVGDPRVRSGI
jgi:hypothetical protein